MIVDQILYILCDCSHQLFNLASLAQSPSHHAISFVSPVILVRNGLLEDDVQIFSPYLAVVDSFQQTLDSIGE